MTKTSWRRTIITLLLGCSFSLAADGAFAAQFGIQHDTDYVYMNLPATLGESTVFEWGLAGPYVEIFGLSGVADPAEVTVSGVANIGPLLSLDAEWKPDGSIGSADYVFGEGTFELQLAFSLLDGTPHTMYIHGATGPMSMSVDDDGYWVSGDFSMSIPNAKVDRESAALFGMKRRITGEVPYYTDVYNIAGTNDREVALFGSMYFNYTPTAHSQSSDLEPVPEPATLSLVGLGLAAVARRFRRT